MITRIILLCALSAQLSCTAHPPKRVLNDHNPIFIILVSSSIATGAILLHHEVSRYIRGNNTDCPACVCPENLPQVTPCATELLHASHIIDPQQLPHTAAVIEQLKEIAERFKNERE